jgi:hypothetical protein
MPSTHHHVLIALPLTHTRVFTPACETPSTSTPTHTRSRSHTHRTLARHMCKDVEAAHPRLRGGVNVSVGVARGGDGKALVFDGDYYGDCVNVASKLGALATSTPSSSSLHSDMPQTRLALCSIHRQGYTDVSHTHWMRGFHSHLHIAFTWCNADTQHTHTHTHTYTHTHTHTNTHTHTHTHRRGHCRSRRFPS